MGWDISMEAVMTQRYTKAAVRERPRAPGCPQHCKPREPANNWPRDPEMIFSGAGRPQG